MLALDTHAFMSAQLKKKPHEQRNETQKSLRTVADMLRTPEFSSWLDETESRFAWGTLELFEKIKRDLVVGRYYSFAAEPTVAEAVQQLADNCEAKALSIIEADNLNLDRDDTRFDSGAAGGMLQAVYDALHAVAWENPEQWEGTVDLEYNSVAKKLNALAAYAAARLTLAEDTGHVGFEVILSRVTDRYMLIGDPSELLSRAANGARRKVEGELWLHYDKCSAQWTDHNPSTTTRLARKGYALYHLLPDSQELKRIHVPSVAERQIARRWAASGKSSGNSYARKSRW